MRVTVILGGNMYEKSIINYYVYEFIYNVDFASISSGSNIIIEKEDVSATSGSNSFSRTLSKLALMNGTATFSSGSISSNAQVTSISLYVRASSGSFPVIIYIQAPDGTTQSGVITQSGTITFNDFSGCNPSGSWKIWF